MRYEIDSDNAVRVFYPDSDIVSLYQPNWPNGDAWANASEAESWANLYITSVIDENAPFAPNSRNEQGHTKPTKEKIDSIRSAQNAINLASTDEEFKAAEATLKSILES